MKAARIIAGGVTAGALLFWPFVTYAATGDRRWLLVFVLNLGVAGLGFALGAGRQES